MRAARAGLLLAAFSAFFSAPLPALAASIYCCADEHGKQFCGDVLPSVCVGKAYRELSQSGMPARQVEAPPTPEQKAQRAAAERRMKREEEAAREQQRLDQVLLQTYSTEEDIELMRKRAQNDVNASIKAAMTKIDEAKVRRKKFEDEAEFYKKRTLPPEVEKGLKDADFEIASLENLIASKQKDLEAIKARYDDERRRFLDVKRRTRLQ